MSTDYGKPSVRCSELMGPFQCELPSGHDERCLFDRQGSAAEPADTERQRPDLFCEACGQGLVQDLRRNVLVCPRCAAEPAETKAEPWEFIGDVRRRLFAHADCEWNGVVRDITAQMERPGRQVNAELVCVHIAEHYRIKAHWARFQQLMAEPAAPVSPAQLGPMSEEMKAHRRKAFAPDEVAAIEREHETEWIREKARQEDCADVRAGMVASVSPPLPEHSCDDNECERCAAIRFLNEREAGDKIPEPSELAPVSPEPPQERMYVCLKCGAESWRIPTEKLTRCDRGECSGQIIANPRRG